jgi:amino-acid N-acetyltransferase
VTAAFDIGPVRADEVAPLLALLSGAKLPGDGLAEHLATALVARSDGRVVASSALEMYGDSALLRSVAVEESMRGTGLGAAMTSAAIDLARRRGVRRLFLLTETASGFFPKFGFRPIARSEVPEIVRQSVEFGSVCCQTAVVMEAAL